MNEDQVLSLTREIATIGSKQDNMMELLREMRQDLQSNYVTKSEHQSMKEKYDREIAILQAEIDARKKAPYQMWMLIATIVMAIPGIVSLITLFKK